MFEVASQIIICLILAALLGWFIGYLMGKATCSKIENVNEGQTSTSNVSTVMSDTTNTPIDVGTQPTLLTAPREGGKDNLQLIKGVGNVLEALLNETGIYHFDQIAKLSASEVTWLDNSMSFPGRIEREEWVAQAKDLAEGKVTEFSQRVERGEVSTSKKS